MANPIPVPANIDGLDTLSPSTTPVKDALFSDINNVPVPNLDVSPVWDDSNTKRQEDAITVTDAEPKPSEPLPSKVLGYTSGGNSSNATNLDTDGIQAPNFSDTTRSGQTSVPGLNSFTQSYFVLPNTPENALLKGKAVYAYTTDSNGNIIKSAGGIVGDLGPVNTDKTQGGTGFGEMSADAAKKLGLWKEGDGNSINTSQPVNYFVFQDGPIFDANSSQSDINSFLETQQNVLVDTTTLANQIGTSPSTGVVSNPTPKTSNNTPDPRIGGRGSAKGMFAVPRAGAKVWVFFHGGDPQRPVYFAQNTEPAAWKAAYQTASPSPKIGTSKTVGSDGETHEYLTGDGFLAENGGLWFQGIEKKSGNQIPENHSYAMLQNGPTFTKLENGKFSVYTPGDIGFSCNSFNINTAGSTSVNTGDSHSFTQGIDGKTTGKASNAAKQKLKTAVAAVEKAKVDAIQNTAADKVECPICATTYLYNNSSYIEKIVNFIGGLLTKLPFNCWNWPITQFFYKMVVIPMLSEISGLGASGGKGCKNPGCSGGQISSSKSKVDAGNKAAADELKNQQKTIDDASKDHTLSPHVISHTSADAAISAGQGPLNDTAAYLEIKDCYHTVPHRHAKSDSKPVKYNESNPTACPVVVELKPTETFGSLLIKADNKIKMIAGSPGIDLKTKGKFNVDAGGVSLTASDGPLVVSSKNVTTVNGKTVVISDSDNGGIRLESRNISVGGALHVDGDHSILGSTSIGGALTVPHMNTISMRTQTTNSSSPKSVTDGATWYLEGSLALTLYDRIRNFLLRDLQIGFASMAPGIWTLSQETINLIMSAIPIHPTMIGFCMTYPQGFTPVFGFRHTHGQVPADHHHDVTIPKGNYYNDLASLHNASPDTSCTPTPAPAHGDGPTPGPKSSGGSCGGGGAGFGNPNSAVSQNRKKRNASVGLADGDYNYSRITVGDQWKYDPYTGDLIPPPTSGLEANCE